MLRVGFSRCFARLIPSLPVTRYSMSSQWQSMQMTNLLQRCVPVPTSSSLSIFNLRELIEKCEQQALVEKLTSITLIDNIAQGTLCLRTVGCSSLHSRLPDIVGITLNALSAVGGMSAKQTCSH